MNTQLCVLPSLINLSLKNKIKFLCTFGDIFNFAMFVVVSVDLLVMDCIQNGLYFFLSMKEAMLMQGGWDIFANFSLPFSL